MRKSTIYWMGFTLLMVVLTQLPMWVLASNWKDLSEARASFVSLAITTVGSIGVMVRELMKYSLDTRTRPADLQRRTTTVAGIPIVDDDPR